METAANVTSPFDQQILEVRWTTDRQDLEEEFLTERRHDSFCKVRRKASRSLRFISSSSTGAS